MDSSSPDVDPRCVRTVSEQTSQLLSDAWGGEVQLTDFRELTGPGRRNQVLSARVAKSPVRSGQEILVKHAYRAQRGNEGELAHATTRFLRDWAGLKFLSPLRSDGIVTPEVFAASRSKRLIVMEHFGDGKDLDETLTQESHAEARAGLLELAGTLGRLHCLTSGMQQSYNQIARRVGLEASPHWTDSSPDEYAAFLEERAEFLGLGTVPDVRNELAQIFKALNAPSEFLAFTHCDVCPDNCRISKNGLQLIDFEFSGFRHALLDGVTGVAKFPTCWCVREIPPDVISDMEQMYRSELVRAFPAAADDQVFYHEAAIACGYWLLQNMGTHFDQALRTEMPRGTCTNRHRLLMRMRAFVDLAAKASVFRGLQELMNRMQLRLEEDWGSDVPLYDAFHQSRAVSRDVRLAMASAIEQLDTERVRNLLQENPGLANSKKPDEDQQPMLYLAVSHPEFRIVQCLLEHGARWQTTTRTGWTTLSRACSHACPEIIDLLLEAGADINEADTWGLRPIHASVSSRKQQNLRHVLARGAQPDLKVAIDLGQKDLMLEILRQDPGQARMTFGTGLTLLHDSARIGPARMDAMRLLLRFGADPNAETTRHATPLHLAALHGHVTVVRLLLEHGADPSLKDRRGRSPWRLAWNGQHHECAMVLAEACPDVPEQAQEIMRQKSSEEHSAMDQFFGQVNASNTIEDWNG